MKNIKQRLPHYNAKYENLTRVHKVIDHLIYFADCTSRMR